MIFADGLKGFGRIHHRFLNNLDLLETLRAREPVGHEFTEIAEGDLCWYASGKNVDAVFLHPSRLNRIPSWDTVQEDLERGVVVRLEDVLDQRFSTIPFVIELKTGKGNTTRALEFILDRLEHSAHGRYWVDSFSPELLAEVKKISPGTPTSLHTRLGVYGPVFVRTSFEPIPVAPRRLSRLPQADAITVTYKYSPARFLKGIGATIDGVHNCVAREGKFLVLGGVENQRIFEEALRSSAVAAYAKWSTNGFGH